MILDIKKIIPLLGIEHGMTVMDMGSSVGFWVKPLAHVVGPTGQIIAVDYHSDIVQRLANDTRELGMQHVQVITRDIHDLKSLSLKKNTCDRVLLVQMLPVIEQSVRARIMELVEFLKPGGRLIVIDREHYEGDLVRALRECSDITFEEMRLVRERSGDYFFGISISSTQD